MGKIKQGILGGFSGVVGNIIGAQWNGIDYMRVKPSSVKNPRTPAQVAQREKFSFSYKLLAPLKGIFTTGLKSMAVGMTPYNWAMSNTLRNVIGGTSPNFTIAPENLIIAKGSVSVLKAAAVESTVTNEIELSWDQDSSDLSENESDKIQFVGYDLVSNSSIVLELSETRLSESATITIDAEFQGATLYCYAICKTADGLSTSDSQYVGSVTVTS